MASSLKNEAHLGPGELQLTRIFQRGQPSLDPDPGGLFPQYGGQIGHELFPEKFFQFLYPKTDITGFILHFLSKEIYVSSLETFFTISTDGLIIYVIRNYGTTFAQFADKLEQKCTQLKRGEAGFHQAHTEYD